MEEYRCEAVCKKATDAALLVEVDGEELWIPQSHILADSEVFDDEDNSTGMLVMTAWIAKKKGLL